MGYVEWYGDKVLHDERDSQEETMNVAVKFMSVVLLVASVSCANASVTQQTPTEYLDGALNWMQTRSVNSKKVDWLTVRHEASALVPNPQTSAETYPAIRLAIARLGDGNAFLLPPESQLYDAGFFASYPENVVRQVMPNGAAEQAGVRVGDVVERVNGTPPRPVDGNPASFFMDTGGSKQLDLILRREGHTAPLEISFAQPPARFDFEGKPVLRRMGDGTRAVGYIELVTDSGGNPAAGRYTGQVHQFMREVERNAVCGWIVDLRHNYGGNLWTYLAAVGPLLSAGKLGGFAYPDGRMDTWRYENGKILWNENVRDESAVAGGVYVSIKEVPRVALVVSRYTIAAGELVGVAFQGRANVRVFGEPTGGIATLTEHTPLSDGAHLFVSGAYGVDKNGNVYDHPIQPDEFIATDWTKFGTAEDAVVGAAYQWLTNQSDCG